MHKGVNSFALSEVSENATNKAFKNSNLNYKLIRNYVLIRIVYYLCYHIYGEIQIYIYIYTLDSRDKQPKVRADVAK